MLRALYLTHPRISKQLRHESTLDAQSISEELFFNKLYILKQFYVKSKTEQKVYRVPIGPLPAHMHSLPNITIPTRVAHLL